MGGSFYTCMGIQNEYHGGKFKCSHEVFKSTYDSIDSWEMHMDENLKSKYYFTFNVNFLNYMLG